MLIVQYKENRDCKRKMSFKIPHAGLWKKTDMMCAVQSAKRRFNLCLFGA